MQTAVPDNRILFLYGNDEYAISQRLRELRARLDPGGMNTTRLEARQTNEDQLNTATNAVPFLGNQRVVVLANPSARYTTPESRKKFWEFLAGVPPTTCLILYESVDNRKEEEENHWLLKQSRKDKASLGTERFMLPRAWEMTGWILQETRAQGGKIAENAAARLAEMTGENTRQAAQEITKLLTYVNLERAITLEDVERVSTMTAQGDIFALVDALGMGKIKDAQAMLHHLLAEQEALYIFSMIVRQFRLIILAREVADAGGGLKDAQGTLGMHPFVAEKVFNQAQHFTMLRLEAIYRRLLEIDEAAKTGEIPLDLGLETFIVELSPNP